LKEKEKKIDLNILKKIKNIKKEEKKFIPKLEIEYVEKDEIWFPNLKFVKKDVTIHEFGMND